MKETLQASLAAAVEWRLLGLLFERPRSGWHEEVASLGREVGDSALQRAAASAQEARESDYLAALGPGGAVSPREVSYRGREDPAHILAEIGAYHRAFGFRPQIEDTIDHVAVEASFAGYLCLKAAYAHAASDAERAGTATTAFQHFAGTHLRAMGEPIAARLQDCGAPEHLLRAAFALFERTGPALEVNLYPGGDDRTEVGEFQCGEAADCTSCPLPPSEPEV